MLARHRAATTLAVAMMCLGTSTARAQVAPSLHTRALAATCATCHGTDGTAAIGVGVVPLAELSEGRIVVQVKAFRDGTRPSVVMQQLSKGYSDAQIAEIAAYFASLRR